jgi:hypothetical protein
MPPECPNRQDATPPRGNTRVNGVIAGAASPELDDRHPRRSHRPDHPHDQQPASKPPPEYHPRSSAPQRTPQSAAVSVSHRDTGLTSAKCPSAPTDPHLLMAARAHPPGPELARSQQAVAGGLAPAESPVQIDEPLADLAARGCYVAAAVAGVGPVTEVEDRPQYSRSYKPARERGGVRIGSRRCSPCQYMQRVIPVEYAQQGAVGAWPADPRFATCESVTPSIRPSSSRSARAPCSTSGAGTWNRRRRPVRRPALEFARSLLAEIGSDLLVAIRREVGRVGDRRDLLRISGSTEAAGASAGKR